MKLLKNSEIVIVLASQKLNKPAIIFKMTLAFSKIFGNHKQ